MRNGWVILPIFGRKKAGYILATVMDLFSHKVIGFSISSLINKELVIQALHNAVLRNGKPDDGLFPFR